MREEIIKVLDNVYEAKDIIEINDMLNLTTSEELQELQSELNKLVEEYIVYFTKKNKYILLKNCTNLFIGRLSVNKKGFGFVIIPKDEDIYIAKDNINSAIDEDIVLCEVINKGIKREGRIIKVVKRELNLIVGTIFFKKDKIFLDLDDKKNITVEIEKDSAFNVVEGHKVQAKIIKEQTKNRYLARILTVIGHKDDPGVDILSIAYKYGIYPEFNAEVEEELKNIPDHVEDSELKGRRDLTDKVIFTIDGDDTKDIDDAISLEEKDGNYVLGVHIADVSNYVKENTALGDEAYKRGTSSYLADTVIPMLPHQLSNGICSLNEGVIRLSMSCVMEIDNNGKVVNYEIFPSYIKSSKKMTYKHVNNLLMRNTVDEGYEPFKDTLLKMNELAHILRKEKISRGYIDFEIDEAKIVQDESGKAIDVIKRVREDGEKLIEDFMIAANECVAQTIYNMDLPFIYRIHENPKPEKVDEFLNLVKILGYKLKTNVKEITPKVMQSVINELKDKPEFPILSTLLLRSMRKAEYSKENLGHFGLASKAYTHFTSPIRRFPDLTVHRLLKKYLVENDMSMTTINTLETSLIEVASQSSEREVAAVDAERDVDDMKMAEYMESHVGEEYEGIISGITSYGMFVELPNLIEGLVHISTLKGDYFNYIEEILSMVGKSTKKTYRLGDKVKVKCVAASKLSSSIDFELVEERKTKDEDTK
ncbi:MAG: ribonuclease R [Firmicutes bacterium]|nr:ribonuclease R [Bacillota bacterium]